MESWLWGNQPGSSDQALGLGRVSEKLGRGVRPVLGHPGRDAERLPCAHAVSAMKRPGGELMGMPATKAPQQPVGMCVKMLMSPKEGAAIIGPSGSHSKQISEMTGSRLHLSSKGEYYPGTQLQEMFVKGPSADSVSNCVLQVLSKLQEETGRISGGEFEVEEGGARVGAAGWDLLAMSLAPSAVVPIPRRGMPWPRELLYAWNCLPAAFGDRDEFEGLAEGLVSLEAPAQPAEPDALVSLHSAVTGTGGVHLWMPSHASAAEVCDETLFQLNSDSADTAAELCQQLRRDGAASKFHFNSEYSPGQVRLMQNDGEVRYDKPLQKEGETVTASY
eukprot:s835_g17.t1